MRGCTCSMNPSGQALLGTPKHLLSRGIMANCTKSMTEIFQKNQSKIPVTIPCCSTMFQNCRQPVLQKLNCLCSFFAHIIHVSFQTLPMRSRSYCKPPYNTHQAIRKKYQYVVYSSPNAPSDRNSASCIIHKSFT